MNGRDAAFYQRVTVGKEVESIEGSNLWRDGSFFCLVSTKTSLWQNKSRNQDLGSKVVSCSNARDRDFIARADGGDDSINDNHGSIFNWLTVAWPNLVRKVDIRLSLRGLRLLCNGFRKGRTDRDSKQQAENQTVWNKFHDVKVFQSRVCAVVVASSRNRCWSEMLAAGSHNHELLFRFTVKQQFQLLIFFFFVNDLSIDDRHVDPCVDAKWFTREHDDVSVFAFFDRPNELVDAKEFRR